MLIDNKTSSIYKFVSRWLVRFVGVKMEVDTVVKPRYAYFCVKVSILITCFSGG
jgi:hypothetical protein